MSDKRRDSIDVNNTLAAAIITDISLDGLTDDNGEEQARQWCESGGWGKCAVCETQFQSVIVDESGYCLDCAAEVIAKQRETIKRLDKKPENYWDEDEKYPFEDWALEAQNNDTRLGYWEWVDARREADQEDQG